MQDAAIVEAIEHAAVDRVDELSALYRLTDRLYRAKLADDVYEAALDAIVGTLGCERASILLFNDQGVMDFVAWRGLSEGYRQALNGHSPWRTGDLDPDPILVEDIEATDESRSVKDRILAENIRSLAFIPLLSRRRVIGKFMSYYADTHRFAPEEIDMAVTIARQLGFAIERMRSEEALRESEERFRELSEDAPVMLWMSDAEGRCLHLNRLLRRFWGVAEDGLAAFDWQGMIHDEDRPAIAAAMREAVLHRRSANVEGRYLNASGQYRLLTTTARPRFAPDGQFLGMIGVNVDATEKREAELALRGGDRVAQQLLPRVVPLGGDGLGGEVHATRCRDDVVGHPRHRLLHVGDVGRRPHPFHQRHGVAVLLPLVDVVGRGQARVT